MTASRKINRIASDATPSPARWITHGAFLLALIVIIARMTTVDVLRDPWEASPGGDPSAGPGPGTGLVFDLLAMLPAIGVLVRRAVDRNYRLLFQWSHCLLFPLAMFAVLSTAWSADRFSAAVTSTHFFAAACLLWAMTQIVRSPARFRLVSAISFGLLIVIVIQIVEYQFVEAPLMVENWNQNKDKILKSHNYPPESFAAKQFEAKVLNGEVLGFFKSPNSAAAVGVLLFFACVGIGIQKYLDGDDHRWLMLPTLAAGMLIWILIKAKSKTSAATPVLGTVLLILFWVYRTRLRAIRGRAFVCSVILVAFTTIAVIGHGIHYHGLFPGHFSNSLDFRWKYWSASFHIFTERPLVGIGWNNFGLHYLAHRLPEAAEEINDPHNFVVHFFIELGLLGGLLCLGWLLRLSWEVTVRSTGETTPDSEPTLTIRSALIAVIGGMLISVIANSDFSQGTLDLLSSFMKPLLFALALALGTIGAAMLSPHEWSLDDRPAPWIFYCAITGIGLFLIHNLIDFSLFEASAMFVFMSLIGSVQGLASAAPRRSMPRAVAIATAVIGVLGWILSTTAFVAPVLEAEQLADAGNEQIRTAPTDVRAVDYMPHFRKAAEDFSQASRLVPFNADYFFREARAALSIGEIAQADRALAQARHENPLMIETYLWDARIRLHNADPDRAIVLADFETAIKLNPNNVTFHEEYAQALEKFGLRDEARLQYKAAVAADEALPIGEPKHLLIDELTRLKQKAGF